VAIVVYRALLLEAYVAVVVLIVFRIVTPECALVFPSVFAAFRLWRDIAAYSTPRRLDPVVKRTAGLHLVFGLLYTVGVLIGA
jgi:1,4-dihydroxy-2-naphthoate octaprenyltransferase